MTGAPVRVFVGLGSNLEDPAAQVRSALDELDAIPATRRVARSALFRSPPIGPVGQPDYVNAVAELSTRLAAEALLDALLAIEQRHGRLRRERWGPRTLDLDLLLYGDAQIHTPRLVVPHPEMQRRAFVLLPLAEIDPTLVLPDGTALADALAQVDAIALERLGG